MSVDVAPPEAVHSCKGFIRKASLLKTPVMAFSIIQNFVNKFTHFRRSSPFRLVRQELLDHIMFYLADDKASLLSCALVHPTWTSISRHHFMPLSLVISSPHRADNLAKLLRSSHETLSSSITGITLVGAHPFWDTFAKLAYQGAYYLLLSVLEAKGTVLRMGAVENDSFDLWSLAAHFPALTALRVACPSYQPENITSFMRALAARPFLRLAELTIELDTDLPTASLSRLGDVRLKVPCLRTLRVVAWNNELVRWLGDNVVGTLERLELESTSTWSRRYIKAAIPLLQGNKETLKDLRLLFFPAQCGFRFIALDVFGEPRSYEWDVMQLGVRQVEVAQVVEEGACTECDSCDGASWHGDEC